jgi:PTS system nitrogen regulatory IIA component
MKLTVHEAARVFDVSEETIERWVRNDGLPHHRVHGRNRFHPTELLEWATQRGIRIASAPPTSVRQAGRAPTFAEALAAGGVHYAVPATDRESLLRAVLERMPLSDDADRELLFDVLLAREKSGSTGVGDGIAIPHVRNPVVLPVGRPVVTLCFLAAPVEFEAIDDKPVHTVFTIVAPTIRYHLFILARLAAVLHDPEFRRAVIERAPTETLLSLARAAEERFSGTVPAGVDEADEIDHLDDGEGS